MGLDYSVFGLHSTLANFYNHGGLLLFDRKFVRCEHLAVGSKGIIGTFPCCLHSNRTTGRHTDLTLSLCLVLAFGTAWQWLTLIRFGPGGPAPRGLSKCLPICSEPTQGICGKRGCLGSATGLEALRSSPNLARQVQKILGVNTVLVVQKTDFSKNS